MATPAHGLDAVVVATDFSPSAQRALDRVPLLPLAPGAKVYVAHALRSNLPRKVRAAALADAHRRLKAAAGALGARARGASVKPVLLHGEPLAELHRLCDRVSADVVVVGRHGERPVADQLLGTLAEGLVRVASPPVLVIHLRAVRPWRRIMVATDGTDEGAHVMQRALSFAPGNLERADLVHAYHVPFEGFLAQSLSTDERRKLRGAYRAEAAAAVSAAVAAWPGEVPWHKTLRAGDARIVVLEQVAHRRTELLCVGSHRRSWFGATLLGSVAQWLVRAAQCDVLVVPPSPVSARR